MTCNEPPEIVLLRFGELTLKSEGVRRHFLNLLVHHIRSVLEIHGISAYQLEQERNRIFIHSKLSEEILRVLSKWVSGIVSLSRCYKVPYQIDALSQCAISLLQQKVIPNTSFRVTAHRSIKKGPISPKVQIEVGSQVFESFQEYNYQVDLHNPDLNIEIEGHGDHAYLYIGRDVGLGGLPVGSQNTISVVTSGHPHDILAAWFLLHRGTSIRILHYPPEPTSTEVGFSTDQIQMLFRHLANYLPDLTISYYKLPSFSIDDDADPNHNSRWLQTRIRLLSFLNTLPHFSKLGIILGESLHDNPTTELQVLAFSDRFFDGPIYRPLIGTPIMEIQRLLKHLEFPEWTQKIPNRWIPALDLEDIKQVEETISTKKNPSSVGISQVPQLEETLIRAQLMEKQD